jgi:NAD(P)-dependent dehydrogenase (short-subunit alcohol dehydrogenase family)
MVICRRLLAMPSGNPALFDIGDKVALVTGAGRGMGRAACVALADAGACIVASDLDEAAAAQVAEAIVATGGRGLGVACDVGDDGALQHLVDAASAHFGHIDILVSHAGVVAHTGPVRDATDAQYARTLDVNLRSAWKLTSLIAPGMISRRDGAIVLTSSIAGLRGSQAVGLYSVSKAGLAALARNLAVELGPHNVRVNAISPGLISTDFVRGITDQTELMEKRKAQTPLRRLGTAEEIAGTILYLVSPAGAFTTGQNIVVDGGTTISDGY